jgi:predicted phage baseplate assembly protein
LPALRLTASAGHPGEAWTAVRDLIGCHRFARRFVLELSEDGVAEIRFGDGVQGRRPPRDVEFEVTARVGGGPAGNVAAGAIRHIVSADPHVVAAVNLVGAVGGAHREGIEQLRHRAPYSWRSLEACVTPEDYQQRALDHAGVADAFARWSADSPHELLELFVVPRWGDASSGLMSDIQAFIEPHRVIGHRLVVRDAAFVDLVVDLAVLISPRHDSEQVEARVRTLVASLAGGPDGIPGQFGLGRDVHGSRIVSAAMDVPGVTAVLVNRLARADGQATDSASRTVPIAPWEVARLRSSSLHIECRGSL